MQISGISTKKDIYPARGLTPPQQSLVDNFTSFFQKPVESIIQPLLDATIKSVEASDPTAELQAQIDNATEGSTLTVPSGNYETININKNITLNGQEPPPQIKRINATDASQLTLNHLDIGNKGLSPAQVRTLPESETGIRVVLNNKPSTINITNTHLSGVADGISISSHTPLEQTSQQKINIDNNTISNIRPLAKIIIPQSSD